MTLKEKFKIINCTDCDMPYCDIRCTILAPYELEKLEQIADYFAIGFFKWYQDDMNISKIKQLLKIYKKEKKL